MSLRDYYEAWVEKTANAAEGDSLAEAESPPNNAQSTTADHHRIMEDDRNYLHSIFSQAGAVQSNQSAEIKKMFSLPHDTVTSHPLIKTAYREIFFEAAEDVPFLKTASAVHREVAFNAFIDEIEKIAQI